MAKTKTYDRRCFELAEHFLADEPRLNTDAAKITLAALIQECVEGEISFMRGSLLTPAGQKEPANG